MPITNQDTFAWEIFRSLSQDRRAPVLDGQDDDRDALARCQALSSWLDVSQEQPFRAVIVEVSEGKEPCRIRILSGSCPEKLEIIVLPAGITAVLKCENVDEERRMALVTLEGTDNAFRPQPGNFLCEAARPANQSDMFSLNVLWLDAVPLFAGRTYHITTCSGSFDALVGKLKNRIDPETRLPLATRKLSRGEIGQIEIEVDGSVIFDSQETPSPLSFVLFRHKQNGAILGIGLIRFALRRASNIRWQELEIDKRQRAAALGQKPLVLWFTGLSGCGKSTVASLLEKRLHEMGKHTYVLDGDNVRHGLCKDLGFTKADRVENMRRVTEVAKLMVDAGLIVLVTFISPFREERAKARASFENDEFVEIFVDTPLEICEARDVKGLYAKARAGLIKNFTGIDSPYEPPVNPEVRLDGVRQSTEEMVETILNWLRARSLLEPPT